MGKLDGTTTCSVMAHCNGGATAVVKPPESASKRPVAGSNEAGTEEAAAAVAALVVVEADGMSAAPDVPVTNPSFCTNMFTLCTDPIKHSSRVLRAMPNVSASNATTLSSQPTRSNQTLSPTNEEEAAVGEEEEDA